MDRKSAARTFDPSKLLLWSALVAAAGASELAYSLSEDRERGSYSNYDSYSNPISRPTHRFPAPAAERQQPAEAAQPAAAVTEQVAAPVAVTEQVAAPAANAVAAVEESRVRERPPADVIGRRVVSADGDAVGQVQAVLRDKRDQQLKALVAADDVPDLGGKALVVPLDQLQPQQSAGGAGPVLATRMNRNELRQLAAYEPESFETVDAAPQVAGPSAVE